MAGTPTLPKSVVVTNPKSERPAAWIDREGMCVLAVGSSITPGTLVLEVTDWTHVARYTDDGVGHLTLLEVNRAEPGDVYLVGRVDYGEGGVWIPQDIIQAVYVSYDYDYDEAPRPAAGEIGTVEGGMLHFEEPAEVAAHTSCAQCASTFQRPTISIGPNDEVNPRDAFCSKCILAAAADIAVEREAGPSGRTALDFRCQQCRARVIRSEGIPRGNSALLRRFCGNCASVAVPGAVVEFPTPEPPARFIELLDAMDSQAINLALAGDGERAAGVTWALRLVGGFIEAARDLGQPEIWDSIAPDKQVEVGQREIAAMRALGFIDGIKWAQGKNLQELTEQHIFRREVDGRAFVTLHRLLGAAQAAGFEELAASEFGREIALRRDLEALNLARNTVLLMNATGARCASAVAERVVWVQASVVSLGRALGALPGSPLDPGDREGQMLSRWLETQLFDGDPRCLNPHPRNGLFCTRHEAHDGHCAAGGLQWLKTRI